MLDKSLKYTVEKINRSLIIIGKIHNSLCQSQQYYANESIFAGDRLESIDTELKNIVAIGQQVNDDQRPFMLDEEKLLDKSYTAISALFRDIGKLKTFLAKSKNDEAGRPRKTTELQDTARRKIFIEYAAEICDQLVNGTFNERQPLYPQNKAYVSR